MQQQHQQQLQSNQQMQPRSLLKQNSNLSINAKQQTGMLLRLLFILNKNLLNSHEIE